CFFFFFFQAEDGIRDGHVTGVQTCALPIFDEGAIMERTLFGREVLSGAPASCVFGTTFSCADGLRRLKDHRTFERGILYPVAFQIGRASCRERGEISVVDVAVKEKEESKKK